MFLQIKPKPPQNKMIRPEEGSVFFFLITLAFLAMQFIFISIAFFLDNIPQLYITIINIVIHAVFIALYYFLVIRRKRFLRYPVLNSIKGEEKRGVLWLVIICCLAVVIAVVSFVSFHMPHYWFNSLLNTAAHCNYGFVPCGNCNTEYGCVRPERYTGIANSVLLGIMVIGLAPISEELIFRGAIISGLSRITKPYKAVLLTALAFTLFHINPLSTVYQFIMGVVIGFAVVFSRKLIVGIIIHAISNTIVFTLTMLSFYMPVYNYPYPPFTVFDRWYASIINYLSSGAGIAVAIAILVTGSAFIVGAMYLFKKFTPKELELPPLDEPVKVSQSQKDMFEELVLGMGSIFSQMSPGQNPFFPQNANGGFNANKNIDPFAPMVESTQTTQSAIDPNDPFVSAGGQNASKCNAVIDCKSCGRTYTAMSGVATKCEMCGTPNVPNRVADMQTALENLQNQPDDLVEDPILTKMRSESRKRATWRYFWLSVGVSVIMWTMIFVAFITGC